MRARALIPVAIAIATIGFTLACGGGGSSRGGASVGVDPRVTTAAEAYKPLWTASATANLGLLIAPWGDVVALDYTEGVVLARDSGKVVDTFRLRCVPIARTARFADDHTLLVRCSDTGLRITLPGGATADDPTPYSPDGPSTSGFDTFGAVTDRVDLGPDLVALSGFHGLQLFASTGGEPLRTLGESTALAAGEPGRVCAVALFGGTVDCWASAPIAASIYDAAAIPPPDPEHPAASTGVHEGTIAKVSRGTVTLTTTGGRSPPVGVHGTLSKYVETDTVTPFGSTHMTMWLDIAQVEVTASTSEKVVCTIVTESSPIVVDGKKVDQFKTGAITHLTF